MSESVSTAREVSYRVLVRVREARLPSVASALAFTTLLSLVPLMTVGFAILAVFPAFDAWRGQVESLLYTNLIPATGDVVSSYLQEFSGQAGTLTGLGLSVLVITALYLIIPSREVRFRFALVGALIAVALFELAKYGFVFFIGNFDTYQVIYGALWTIPVFLVWIYLSWLVTLLGACVSAELGNTKKTPIPPPRVRPVVGGKSPRL